MSCTAFLEQVLTYPKLKTLNYNYMVIMWALNNSR